MSKDLIPFQVDTSQIVELLAKQIYQSPLALLRENVQNAFDAVQERLYMGSDFQPKIDISLTPDKMVICDNGIGMTSDHLLNHYWKAGSSSKNNELARAAGVVGTFGIGAMANFGIADRLIVETEHVSSRERTICCAERSKLDINQDCIERDSLKPSGQPGTKITAYISDREHFSIQKAREYIREFVSLVKIPVCVNGITVSQKSYLELVPKVPKTWQFRKIDHKIGSRMKATIDVVLSNNADLWIQLDKISWESIEIPGRLVLRSGQSILRTYRNGFGLAVASVNSFYKYGGIADLRVLEPTAGREAITVDGLRFLQNMMVEIDLFTSELLANQKECDSSASFMEWVAQHHRFELCGKLKMTIEPGGKKPLEEIARMSRQNRMNIYSGSDLSLIKTLANEHSPLLIHARTNPWRYKCEQGYLRLKADTNPVLDLPFVKNLRSRSIYDLSENAIVFRVESILDTDYFIKCSVEFGSISHNLPVLVEKTESDLIVYLDSNGQSIQHLKTINELEFVAFNSMTKDFVRNMIFPRISNYVPSSTRQGAEAFLQAIRNKPEQFEYADVDLGSLPEIWQNYQDGQISLVKAVKLSQTAVRSSIQEVNAAVRVNEVVPDVIQNEQALRNEVGMPNLDPWPGILRLESSSSHKLLIIDEGEPDLRGYRCFLAISDKARDEYGEFFLQPHLTSVVWGGQKTLFIFMHHSRQFGLYYDLQTLEVIDVPAGGGAYPTCSIVLNNRLYIPIPQKISKSFIPNTGEKKRFEVRADILSAGKI